MSPSVVQFIAGTSSTASGTLASPATAGSRLVLVVFTQNGSSATNTVTCGSMTSIDAQNGASGASRGGIAAFHVLAAGGETSVSFSISGSNTACSLLLEISGLATSSAVDITFPGTDLNSVSGSVDAGNNTTTNAADYIIVAIGGRTSTTFSTWTDGVAPMTVVSTATNGNAKGAVAVHAVSSTASYTPGASLSSAVIGGAVAVAFKQAGATQTRSAALNATATLSAGRKATRRPSATLNASATLSSSRTRTQPRTVALNAVAALASFGSTAKLGAANLAALATLTASRVASRLRSVTLNAVATLTSTATAEAPGEPTLFCDWGGLDIEIDPGARSIDATVTCDWGGLDIQAQAVVYDHGDTPPRFVPAAIALYSPDNEWLANFPNAVGVAFRDGLLGPSAGYVSCSIPLDDPNYSLIGPNTILKAIWKGRARAAAPVKVSDITINTSTEGRPFREFKELPDLLTVALGSIPIYPEWELNRASSQSRISGYPSRKRSAWGNWTFAQGVPWTDETGVKKGLPRGLDSGVNPWWISKDGPHADKAPGYKEYLWRAFTTYQEMTFEISATGDNHLTLYLDGEQIFTPDLQQGMTWRHLGKVTVTIPEGRHVLAAKLANIRTLIKVHPDSPVALLLVMRQLDNKGNPVKGPPFLISDNRWLASSLYPGFHGGEIIRMLWDEGDANEFAWAQRLGISLSPHRDSHGHLYDDDVQERIFDVGGPVLTAAQQLCERALDMCLDATTNTVQGFNRAGADLSSTVAFKFGANDDDDLPVNQRGSIRDYRVTRTEPTTNSVLVQRADGSWAERNDDASIAAYGKEGAGLSLGSSAEDDTVGEVANAQFDETAHVRRTYTLEVATTRGPQPYDSYANGGVHKGDSFLIPIEDLTSTEKVRMTAVIYDGSTDEQGQPTITLEVVTDPT